MARPPEPEYGGFWLRLGAYLLDALIMAPFSVAMIWASNHDHRTYYFSIIPGLAVFIAFHVWSVKRWGGTPGKLICGLRVMTCDFKPAGWREAWLRQSVLLALTIVSYPVFIHAAEQMSAEEYRSLGWMARTLKISQLAGLPQTILNWAFQIWTWSEFLVLLTNPQRRAIHDFIAGTVVVRKS